LDLPKQVEECVKKRLANPDFQAPKNSDKNREEFAWALCQTLYKKGQLDGMTVEIEGKEYWSLDGNEWFAKDEGNVAGFKLEPVTDDDLKALNLLLGAKQDKNEILKFSNAFLAREESNKNKDDLNRKNLEDIAQTLPLRAIDFEHREKEIVGLFINGLVKGDGDRGGVATDGIVYARRRPDVAMGLMNGELKLSIEADADSAQCSLCGQIFKAQADYCEHLQGRLQGSGAVRRFPGTMKALGGAVTKNPAGSGTDVPRESIVMIASQIKAEGDDSTDEVVIPEDEKSKVKGGVGVEELEKVKAELQEKVKALEALMGEKDALEAEKAELTTQLEAAQKERDDLKAEMENDEKFREREEKLAGRLTPEVIAEKKEVILGFDDAAFEFFLASLPEPAAVKAAVAGSVAPGSGDTPPPDQDTSPKWVRQL